jgi:hypothetical protein
MDLNFMPLLDEFILVLALIFVFISLGLGEIAIVMTLLSIGFVVIHVIIKFGGLFRW